MRFFWQKKFKPSILDYMGVFSIFTFYIGISICFLTYPNIVNDPSTGERIALSDFGAIKATENIFAVTLIITAILGFLFTIHFIYRYPKKVDTITRVLLNSTFLFLLGIAFVPYTVSYQIHFILAVFYFFIFSLAVFSLGLDLYKDRTLAHYLKTTAVYAPVIVVVFYFTRIFFVGQLLFTIFTSTWIVIMSRMLKKDE